jgi:hypothetical protein
MKPNQECGGAGKAATDGVSAPSAFFQCFNILDFEAIIPYYNKIIYRLQWHERTEIRSRSTFMLFEGLMKMS